MADHEIVWKLDADDIRGEAVCNMAEGADCRLTCPKGCESWSTIFHDEGPYHMAEDWPVLQEERHYMAVQVECNICLFLNEDDAWIQELHADRTSHEIGRLTISPIWMAGGGYEYKVIDDET